MKTVPALYAVVAKFRTDRTVVISSEFGFIPRKEARSHFVVAPYSNTCNGLFNV